LADLIFCYAAYNAERAFRRSLKSVKPFADRIIVIEGRFLENPHGGSTKNSTDRTVEIAREFTDEIIVAGDLPQHIQRDLYLKGRDRDFYFIIDADEVLHCGVDSLHNLILAGDYDVYAVSVMREVERPTARQSFALEQLCLRVFAHKSGIRHNVGQCPLIDDKGKLMDGSNYDVKEAKLFWLEHI